MDLITKIGGRKFILALIVIGICAWIEMKTDRGLTANVAAVLLGTVLVFAIANFLCSKTYLQNKSGSGRTDSDLHSKLDRLLDMSSPENTQVFAQQIHDIGTGVQDLKAATLQIGTAMLNIGTSSKVPSTKQPGG